MAELEVSIVFDERKCSNQEQFLYRQWIFNVISLTWFFLHYLWKDTRMNFESGFCNFGNIFFTIAGNIYVNRW